MHEMSLAMSIVEIASNAARSQGGKIINHVEVEVGSLAGVMEEALSFCFAAAAQDSIAAGATLKIIPVAAKARCADCGEIQPIDSFFDNCPRCQGHQLEIIQGRELHVLSIIVDE
ncbi:MAG: hydrogenase maturation nickel metallochaperone HypA [Deltaproteobacteria bacterium RIFOXYD12_FULL_50_9]|nr:MAG: hydrogenase maturation nickel metallochaperone HypA [Deltaproteobacteria bacterium RIFOXYD12_FULL_50_9]